MATLTYVYLDSTAVLGPLALRPEPHAYDLCEPHASGLSAPRGWEVIRLEIPTDPEPSTDDLLALADAVREVGFSFDGGAAAERASATGSRGGATERHPGVVELARRGHLTVLADPDA